MASSPHQDTSFVLDFVNNADPESVLDVGAGFGRWGFLIRCHLTHGTSLTVNPRQRIRIDAIEAHRPNINPVYQAVYDNTYEGDVREVLPGLAGYDVIICSHVIEHMPKDDGWRLIGRMKEHARKALILGLPFNDPLREARDGNEFEAHRSVWRPCDFRGQSVLIKAFPFSSTTDLGVVIFPLDDNTRWHARTLRNPLRAFAVRHLGVMRALARLRKGRGGGGWSDGAME